MYLPKFSMKTNIQIGHCKSDCITQQFVMVWSPVHCLVYKTTVTHSGSRHLTYCWAGTCTCVKTVFVTVAGHCIPIHNDTYRTSVPVLVSQSFELSIHPARPTFQILLIGCTCVMETKQQQQQPLPSRSRFVAANSHSLKRGSCVPVTRQFRQPGGTLRNACTLKWRS